jgi:hypothetical protein
LNLRLTIIHPQGIAWQGQRRERLHKLRRAMIRSGWDRLAGMVEVDEIFIGGERSGQRGRGAPSDQAAKNTSLVD